MKYIIDLDALKECLELLAMPHKKNKLVSVEAVNKMIDKFPKEEFSEDVKDNKKTTTSTVKAKAAVVSNEVLDTKEKVTNKK